MANQSAASRLTRSDNQQLRRAVRRALHMVTPAAMLLLSAGPAWAAPEQGAVVRGAASIEAAGPGMLNINQTSDRAVINWRSFSVGQNEQVNFNQPGSSSATLNRVLGGQRSVIEGALNANGNVYLLNSSGILFSSSARVDVGGLVATTSEVRDDDFMRGQLQFNSAAAPGASITNLGTISIRDGGIAALVAPSVRNQGVIAARAGRVALGAGDVFTLDLYGDQLINFAVPASLQGALQSRTVDQAGTITADGGQILMTTDAAAGVVSGVVNMSGITQARTVEQTATGEIVLVGNAADVIVSGTLDASGMAPGAVGGTVDVFGHDVRLTDTAVVDARGAAGGGVVRLGGGLASEQTPRAETTTIASGATIDVGATDAGNGGTVAVWGNDKAEFAGTINARGGAAGGDGGFVEVSSKGLLQFLGNVQAEAPQGKAGTVLLDPESIRIEAIGSNSPTASVIAASALNGLLRQGLAVILLADNSITVNAAIDGRPLDGSGTASGSVDLTAGSILMLRPIITSDAAISVNATSGSITFGSEAFLYVAQGSGVGSAPISVTAAVGVDARQLVSLGTITVRATAGDVHLREALYGLAAASGSSGIGELRVIADAGSVNSSGARSNGSIVLTAGNGITNAGQTLAAANEVQITAGGGGVRLESAGAGAAGIDSGGSVTIATPGAVTLNSGIRTAGAPITLGGAEADRRIASLTMLQGAALQTVLSASSPQGGAIGIFANGPVAAQGLVAGQSGAVTVSATGSSGNVTLAQPLAGLANATTQIGSLSIDASGNVQTNGVRAAQTVTISGASVTNSANSIVAGGDVRLTATGTGGITLNRVEDPADSDDLPEAAIDSGGSVTLDTTVPAQVTLNSGIRTNGADIRIGSGGARVASVTMGAGAALQSAGFGANATDQNGNISIDSGGTVSAQALAAGEAGTVTIAAAGAVTVNQAIAGLSGSSGVGAVSITSADSIHLRGANAAGAIDLTADGGIINDTNALVGGSIALTANADASDASQVDDIAISAGAPAAAALDSQGDVRINSAADVLLGGSVRAASGSIVVGNSADPTRIGSFSMAAGTAAAAVNGDLSIYTAGTVAVNSLFTGSANGVTIRGSRINLSGPIDGPGGGVGFVDVAASAVGGASVYDIDFSGARAGGSGGVRLVVPNGGRIALRGPILSAGNVLVGRASASGGGANAYLNLSHNIFTTGADITINADVELFAGIDRWALETLLTNGSVDTLDGLFQAADPSLVLPSTNPPTSSSQVCDVPGECSATHTPLCTTNGFACTVKTFDENGDQIAYLDVPAALAMRFVTSDLYAVEVNEDGELIGNRNSSPAQCSNWVCGYRSSNDVATELARVSGREQVLTRLLGVLSASLETSGGDVQINGSVGRTAPGITVNDPLPNSVDLIMPTFMNVGLSIDTTSSGAGTGSIAVSGLVGDSLDEVQRIGVPLELDDSVTTGPSAVIRRDAFDGIDLGVFTVQLNGNVQQLQNGYGDFRDGAGQPLGAAALVDDGLNYAGLQYRLNIWTTGDKGTTALRDVSPPGQLPGFQFIAAQGDGSGSANFFSGAATNGLASGPSPGLSVGSSSGDTVTTTIENESRRKVEGDLGEQEAAPGEETSCPGGAGDIADMGETRGVDGVAPDVFARCREAG